MNIFILERKEDGSIDWKKSAQTLDNYRIVKMPLENAQMLCTNINVLAEQPIAPYRTAYKNHPCTIWSRLAFENFISLAEHGIYMCEEYTKRFGKTHKCEDIIYQCIEFAYDPRVSWEASSAAPLPLCMPVEYKTDDIVESYRKYYASKPRMRYPKNKIPEWFIKYRGNMPYEVIE